MVSIGPIGLNDAIIGVIIGSILTFSAQYLTTRLRIKGEAVQRRGEIFIEKEVEALMELNRIIGEIDYNVEEVYFSADEPKKAQSKVDDALMRKREMDEGFASLDTKVNSLNEKSEALFHEFHRASPFLEDEERRTVRSIVQLVPELNKLALYKAQYLAEKEARTIIGKYKELDEETDIMKTLREGMKLIDEEEEDIEQYMKILKAKKSRMDQEYDTVEEVEEDLDRVYEELEKEISDCVKILQNKISEPVKRHKESI